MSAMIEDLAASLTEAIEKTVEPLKEQRERIVLALDENGREKRELDAQLERADRMIDAAKMRKRPGRPAGPTSRRGARQQEPAPA